MIVRVSYNKVIEDYLIYLGYANYISTLHTRDNLSYIFISTCANVYAIHSKSRPQGSLQHIKEPYIGLKMLMRYQ